MKINTKFQLNPTILASIGCPKVFAHRQKNLDFTSTEVINIEELINELKKFNPSEIIIPNIHEKKDWVDVLKNNFFVNTYNDVYFYSENAKENLTKQIPQLQQVSEKVSMYNIRLKQTKHKDNIGNFII